MLHITVCIYIYTYAALASGCTLAEGDGEREREKRERESESERESLRQWENIVTHTVTYHIETWDDLAGISQETSEPHIFSHPTGLFLEVSL